MTASEHTELLPAWSRIVAERQRQIHSEGWAPDHDDQHVDGEMLRAAVLYIWHGTSAATAHRHLDGSPQGWPWDAKWWKPKDRIRNLERAGALCLAEHDRCVRAGKSTGPADHKLGIALRELAAELALAAGPDGAEPVPVASPTAAITDDMLERVAGAIYAEADDIDVGYGIERLKSWRDEPHCGDCTGVAATCMQCLYGDFMAKARAALHPTSETTEEPEKCFICDEPFKVGEMVLHDVNEGLGHRACFGEDREAYVKDIDTGEPLGPDDPIPDGFPYEPDEARHG